MATHDHADLTALATAAGGALRDHGWMAATAESCTGGWLAKALTDVPGSSAWFERGFVTYSNAAKFELLGVRPATVERHGAVSGETAREMAVGALRHSGARVAIAVTGIAGPEGGSADKPVGTVWFAVADPHGCRTERALFPGDRDAVRGQAVGRALQLLIEACDGRRARTSD